VQYVDPSTTGTQALVANPDVESAAKANVEEAFPSLTSHELWPQTYFHDSPPVVDIGCPAQPLPLTVAFSAGVPTIETDLGGYVDAVGVDAPSYYSLFVFVVPAQGDIDRLLGETDLRLVPQEFLCSYIDTAHEVDCGQVTEAAYVTVDEIESGGAFWTTILAQGAGLEINHR
jgi:hypothetical protein